MTVSLLVSTYNWPRALYLCLDSVMQQTVLPDKSSSPTTDRVWPPATS